MHIHVYTSHTYWYTYVDASAIHSTACNKPVFCFTTDTWFVKALHPTNKLMFSDVFTSCWLTEARSIGITMANIHSLWLKTVFPRHPTKSGFLPAQPLWQPSLQIVPRLHPIKKTTPGDFPYWDPDEVTAAFEWIERKMPRVLASPTRKECNQSTN